MTHSDDEDVAEVLRLIANARKPKEPLPAEFEPVRQAAERALGPVRPIDGSTAAAQDFLFNAKRSEAGRDLPAYYLVYFLLVDLLGFKNLGQFEKISWSVPVVYRGKAFLIEHRKFGVGVFVDDPEKDEKDAQEIVKHINKAIKVAQPFFDWLATRAVDRSAVNVVNNSDSLFKRFSYFLESYRSKSAEAEARKDEKIVAERKTEIGTSRTISFPAFKLRTEASWLALSAIESFFSWTEHVFIHIAVLTGKIKTGKDVARLAEADWSEKFKHALDLSEPASKSFYDGLIEIRRELRNFVAHGAFGKDGKAFNFHSGAGAVPVLLPYRRDNRRFILGEHLSFEDDAALQTIEEFIKHLWSGSRAPAEIYIQRSHLPVILTMAADGTYTRAMQSREEMEELVDHLAAEADRAANMDW